MKPSKASEELAAQLAVYLSKSVGERDLAAAFDRDKADLVAALIHALRPCPYWPSTDSPDGCEGCQQARAALDRHRRRG